MTVIKDEISDAKIDCCLDPEEIELIETSMRTKQEIIDAEDEYFHKVWYTRHKLLHHHPSDPQIALNAEKAAKAVESKYGNVDNWFPKDDFDLGYLNGILSALRWVLGEDWGDLDT